MFETKAQATGPFLLQFLQECLYPAKMHTNLPVLEEQTDAVPLEAIPDTPQVPPHFARRNERGLIELVDMHTGRIIAMQASVQDYLQGKFDKLVRIDTPQGPVWLEKGLNFDLVHHLQAIPYSKLLADLLCESIVNGKTLVSAAKDLNVPYSTVIRWKRDHDDFKLALEEAQRDRAEYLHDEVLDAARNEASPKDKISALQWAAEKGNSEKFGAKTKLSGDKDAPITFVLSTGIRRPGDAGYAAPQEKEAERVLPAAQPNVEAKEEIAYKGGMDES